MFLFYTTGFAHQGESHKSQQEATEHKLIPSKVVRSWNRTWGKDYFPDITLVTQDRQEVNFFDDLIEDKVVAVNFIFTACEDVCPLETAQLKQVYNILGDRMGKDIFFYSISIDPDDDTPEVLKAYKEQFGITGPGWTFLTGNEAEIIELRKKFGLYQPDLSTDDDHNINLIIGNQSSGRWMRRSPFENSHVLATHLGDWLHNWQSKTRVAAKSYDEAPEIRPFETGETLFRTRCSSCHNFVEDGVGPNLRNVTQLRDRNWLTRWIKEPDKMLAEKDPLAIALKQKYRIVMPNLRLNDQDVEKLLSYIETESNRLDIANN